MRELKREEYGMISGGIDTTNLHTVRVDGSSSGNFGGYVDISSSGNGLSRVQANEACDSIGAAARLGAKANAALKLAGVVCKQGVINVEKINNKTMNALNCMENGDSYNGATGACKP